jgi:arylsulfatase A-like enzyme/tetratricopeptide (TPR) repeat protein
LAAGGCDHRPAPQPPPRPSILLVTLDTTRAEAIGPDARGIDTPAFNALAARGLRFRQAYASAPETLPSHASMMTGLYPAGHGVHENARPLAAGFPVLAEQLQRAGYRTAAFISAYVLARRFGLARGFEVYDDDLPAGSPERRARETTDRAVAFLGAPGTGLLFLWVHYFDPHAPYEPPEPFRSRFSGAPYLGEVAAMDEQLGRLIAAFEQHARGPAAVIVASDHGEGLGDHGEFQHGNLVYQSTMHVPLAIAGPGVTPGTSDVPVSLRRVYHTVLDWAGLGAQHSLRAAAAEVVLGEAMKPFLSYGWQPQIFAVEGPLKAIYAGRFEVYDVVADPGEQRDLSGTLGVPAALRKGADEYPVPSPEAARAPESLSQAARESLASLGYVSGSTPPVVRRDAPRPADMTHLFPLLDRASGLFVRAQYADVVPLLEQILLSDPGNLDAALRLATAHSMLGNAARADAAFLRAARLAPQSADVRLYMALHHARGPRWAEAVPVLEREVAAAPTRLPAVEALARLRERQGREEDALGLWERVGTLRPMTPAEHEHVGDLAMALGRTPLAIEAFEAARATQGPQFRRDLELGLLYLDARRVEEARAALDRVPPSHPDYPMALFKRAQVSVLLREPDAAARIEQARRRATPETRELIARERLFK